MKHVYNEGTVTGFIHLRIYKVAQKVAPFLYALTSSNINRCSRFYLLILLPIPNDIINYVIWHLVSVFGNLFKAGDRYWVGQTVAAFH